MGTDMILLIANIVVKLLYIGGLMLNSRGLSQSTAPLLVDFPPSSRADSASQMRLALILLGFLFFVGNELLEHFIVITNAFDLSMHARLLAELTMMCMAAFYLIVSLDRRQK